MCSISMKSTQFDAIIVGSGFGGSAAAYSLAKAGLKTLLVERGNRAKRDALDWDQERILLKQRYKGKSPIFVKQYNDNDFKAVYPNEVVGGMSVFYGGASLRLRENDFATWPIRYTNLEPYYGKSEHLLEVHGEAGQDIYEPARSTDYPFKSIDLTLPAIRIDRAARKLGYRPFKIPLAINFTNTSRTVCIKCLTCDGHPCKIEAKNDLTTTILRKAQAFDFEIMPDVVVKRFVEKNGKITSVVCIDQSAKRTFELSATVVVLSAGAIHSPAILLRSHLEKYENHTFIGKFLMRHCNATVATVFPFQTNPDNTFHKQVCLTDFYEDFRKKYGSSTGIIQDLRTPSSNVLKHYAPRGAKHLVALLERCIQNVLCIAEDDPSFDNAVGLSSEIDVYGLEIVKVVHQYSSRDCERRDYLVDKAKRIMKQAGGILSYAYNLDSFSHAVGTLRFGNDPKESVLDKNCLFWGIDNLFVLDGSFMPSPGGVNPSLTIAANALRVADYIQDAFG